MPAEFVKFARRGLGKLRHPGRQIAFTKFLCRPHHRGHRAHEQAGDKPAQQRRQNDAARNNPDQHAARGGSLLAQFLKRLRHHKPPADVGNNGITRDHIHLNRRGVKLRHAAFAQDHMADRLDLGQILHRTTPVGIGVGDVPSISINNGRVAAFAKGDLAL